MFMFKVCCVVFYNFFYFSDDQGSYIEGGDIICRNSLVFLVSFGRKFLREFLIYFEI